MDRKIFQSRTHFGVLSSFALLAVPGATHADFRLIKLTEPAEFPEDFAFDIVHASLGNASVSAVLNGSAANPATHAATACASTSAPSSDAACLWEFDFGDEGTASFTVTETLPSGWQISAEPTCSTYRETDYGNSGPAPTVLWRPGSNVILFGLVNNARRCAPALGRNLSQGGGRG